MSEKIPSKADKLREMREASYAANHSSGAKGKPQKPAGSKTGDGLARNNSDAGRKPEVRSRGRAAEASAKVPASEATNEGGKAKFDRDDYHRTYMREYMRKRRAAKNEG